MSLLKVCRCSPLLKLSTTQSTPHNRTVFQLPFFFVGVQFCFHKLEHTKVFKRLGARYKGLPYRPCSHRSFRSTEYWKCYIRHTVESAYHSAGTCRMGHLDHQDTVVDSELKYVWSSSIWFLPVDMMRMQLIIVWNRVKGVLGLRIGDASVMPLIPVAATALPTMMVAEKLAASLIIEYRNGKRPSLLP